MRTLKKQEHFIKCGFRIKPDQSPIISAASPISVAMPPGTVRFTIEALMVAYGKIQFSKDIDRRGLLLNKHRNPRQFRTSYCSCRSEIKLRLQSIHIIQLLKKSTSTNVRNKKLKRANERVKGRYIQTMFSVSPNAMNS